MVIYSFFMLNITALAQVNTALHLYILWPVLILNILTLKIWT